MHENLNPAVAKHSSFNLTATPIQVGKNIVNEH